MVYTPSPSYNFTESHNNQDKTVTGYNQVYEHKVLYKEGYYDGTDYGYRHSWSSVGISQSCLHWCRDNCKGKYGWHFETINSPPAKLAYVTFEDADDAFWFALIRLGKHK